LVAYGHSSGDVVFDSSLPVSDVHASVNSSAVLYGRTFGLAGRSASVGVGLPYVWGSVQGEVAEEFRRITRSGLADARLRLAVNLLGGPALEPLEFAQRRPRTTLGTSLTLQAPTGQYDPSKLINLGSNRWSLKPELGLSHPWGRLYLEVYAGAWLFTDNDDFFGGQHRQQDPIGALQLHVSYSFRPRLWVAGDATFYRGGGTTVAGVAKDDVQENSRLGLTAAFPLGRRQSVKVSWASGFTTRFGGDFQTLAVAWQLLWFDRKK
ncbi:MAG TPA: transporter, partial [Vicinamibacteria bacterium]